MVRKPRRQGVLSFPALRAELPAEDDLYLRWSTAGAPSPVTHTNVVVRLTSFWDQDPEKLQRRDTVNHDDLAMWSFVAENLPKLMERV